MGPSARARSRPLVCVLDDWDGVTERTRAIGLLREVADVDVVREADDTDLLERAREAVVIVPFRERRRITAGMLDALPRLRHIAQTGGIGAHIDLEAARRRGIGVSFTPGVSAAAVAELVLGLIIAAERGLVDAVAALQRGQWVRPLGRQLGSLCLGVVGAGATGTAVARRAEALGMAVLVATRRPEATVEAGFEVVGVPELCRRCDVVSVHVELSPSTRGLLGMEHLEAIGPAGGLVNTARAAAVDQRALLAALDRGALGWAALDVFELEPPAEDPLLAHDRVIATPHLGWRTRETVEGYLERALRNAHAHLTEPSGTDSP